MRATILREHLGGVFSLIFYLSLADIEAVQMPGLYCIFDLSESEIPVAVPPPPL